MKTVFPWVCLPFQGFEFRNQTWVCCFRLSRFQFNSWLNRARLLVWPLCFLFQPDQLIILPYSSFLALSSTWQPWFRPCFCCGLLLKLSFSFHKIWLIPGRPWEHGWFLLFLFGENEFHSSAFSFPALADQELTFRLNSFFDFWNILFFNLNVKT